MEKAATKRQIDQLWKAIEDLKDLLQKTSCQIVAEKECIEIKSRETSDINPILDGVQAHPILDEGGGAKKPPQVNSAIWCLKTMKLGRNTVYIKNFSKQPKN